MSSRSTYNSIPSDQVATTPCCAIVVVAKCPRVGTSKSRLQSLLGDVGSCKLAEALLSDTLVSLSKSVQLSSVLKILLYAPGDKSGQDQINDLLHKLGLDSLDQTPWYQQSLYSSWYLMPINEDASNSSLHVSDLGQLLADGLTRVRKLLEMKSTNNSDETSTSHGSILFLGMDSPELRIGELKFALDLCLEDRKRAYMCPAMDGGYGLLCIPYNTPASIFTCGVRWSSSLTALSQAKALTDHRIDVTFGMMMVDIDVPEDVSRLVTRLTSSEENLHGCEKEVLTEFRHPLNSEEDDFGIILPCPCPFTCTCLYDLGLIQYKT